MTQAHPPDELLTKYYNRGRNYFHEGGDYLLSSRGLLPAGPFQIFSGVLGQSGDICRLINIYRIPLYSTAKQSRKKIFAVSLGQLVAKKKRGRHMLRNCNIYVDLICGNHTPDFLIRAATRKSFSIFKILVLIFRSKKLPSCDQFCTFPSEADSRRYFSLN